MPSGFNTEMSLKDLARRFGLNLKIVEDEFGFGQILVVGEKWTARHRQAIRSGKIAGLRFARSAGWKETKLPKLSKDDLKHLVAVEVYANVDDLTPLEKAPWLRRIGYQTLKLPRIDLSVFPRLEMLSINGKPPTPLENIKAPLRVLQMDGVRGSVQPAIGHFENLENLLVAGRSLTNLDFVQALGSPRELRLYDMWRLKDLSGLAQLHQLERLELTSVQGAIDLSPVFQLPALKYLFLEHCKAIQSMVGVEQSFALESLLLWKSRVIDGDMAPILALKGLKLRSISYHRGYSHRVETIADVTDDAGSPFCR